MKEKEYEMVDDYKQAAQFLVDRIAERKVFGEQLKLMPPEARPEALRLLAELDKAIEEGEQKLANEYESYQAYHRALEAEAEASEQMLQTATGVLVHLKYRHPEKFDEAKAIFFNGWSDEEIESFHDRMAILEADDLIKIIAREGETREQTEEWLKKYRAEQAVKRN